MQAVCLPRLALVLALALSGCGHGGDAAYRRLALPANVPAGTLVNPIVAAVSRAGSADPSVVYRDGYYHYCRSLDDGAIGIASARRLQDIGRVPMTTVWTPPRGTPYSRQLWAPELQYLRGRWVIYFAASDGNNANHRMYALQGAAADVLGPWEFKGRVAAPTDRFAIDGLALEHDGALYFLWSGLRDPGEGFPQVLYIAPMSDPWTISGERREIARPTLAWEQAGAALLEGPAVLRHDGRLHVAYSASASWTREYKLGLLSFTGGDILDARNWVKQPEPVLSQRPESAAWGPGHNAFVKSPDGTQDWIVYHAMDHADAGWKGRSVRAQPFGWRADGLPDFGPPVAVGQPLPQPAGTPAASP